MTRKLLTTCNRSGCEALYEGDSASAPPGWLEVQRPGQLTVHICSYACLAGWAHEAEQADAAKLERTREKLKRGAAKFQAREH